MPLAGQAAVAMWWDIAPEHQREFEDWHSHEHFPERMSIPGFRRGSRFSSARGGEGFFVMYELDVYETLTSPAYLARLNAPTPWSTKMMPRHRNMVRSQCRVAASHGSGVAQSLATVRLSPQKGREPELMEHVESVLELLPREPGITSAHLLHTETPAATVTREQLIRGGDAVADWIVLLGGYDASIVAETAAREFDEMRLASVGARDGALLQVFTLAHTVTPGDL